MNDANMASLMLDIYSIGVRFPEGRGGYGAKVYTYKVPRAVVLQEGDCVVVDTPSTGFTVVKVVRVDEEPAFEPEDVITYKWIVGKVQHEAYDQLRELEAKMAKMIINARRARRRREMVSQNMMDMTLAERDAFRSMIEQVNKFVGGESE